MSTTHRTTGAFTDSRSITKRFAIVANWREDCAVTGDDFINLSTVITLVRTSSKYARSIAIHGLTYEDFAS